MTTGTGSEDGAGDVSGRDFGGIVRANTCLEWARGSGGMGEQAQAYQLRV